MKYLWIVLAFTCAGIVFGYEMGSSYCHDLLNSGAIYDENPHIPLEILDGSAYGKLWAAYGSCVGLLAGVVAAAFWKVWWYQEPIRLLSALKARIRRTR